MSERFKRAYDEGAPWETGQPQAVIVELANNGGIAGTVLDAGCGTGENAIYLAGRGFDVRGIDPVAWAIEQARGKALEREVSVEFTCGSVLDSPYDNAQFDTVVDSGVFHVFLDDERPTYVRQIGRVLKPGGKYIGIVFSEDEPAGWGPRRVTQQEIRDAFSDGWAIESIEMSYYQLIPEAPSIDRGQARAWLMVIRREG